MTSLYTLLYILKSTRLKFKYFLLEVDIYIIYSSMSNYKCKVVKVSESFCFYTPVATHILDDPIFRAQLG